MYNPINLNGYHYANNNPIVYNDPDGEVANWVIGAIIGFATSVASEVGNRMSEGQSFKEALINTFTNEKSLAVIGTSTVIGAATSGLSAVATGAATTTSLTIGSETTRQVVTNAMGKAAVATTSAMTSTFVKGVTTAAIKGEEIDLNSISEQTINAYRTGLSFNVASQGLSSINPNFPESVSTIIENTFPAIYEIRNSFNY